MVHRILTEQILKVLQPGKVIGLYGARRTGKTVLMEEIRKNLASEKILMVHGENLDVAELLSSQRTSVLKRFTEGYEYLFIDEAQKIPNIGQNLKLLVDTLPGISVFVTGSSSFDLHRNIGEPLTGRGFNYFLYPFCQAELKENYLQSRENLESRLIFGLYPQVVLAQSRDEMIAQLESIKNGYLLKDILELDNLKDSIFVISLLRLLAFQIGNDISVNELANTLKVSRKTVDRYLELMQKCYILFSHYGFSNNPKKEISKSPRYYFWDNGIRNAVISNYNGINIRDDIGKLWENYCIAERRKINHYKGKTANYFFWRTYDRKEIDLIEESDGKLNCFEFKWSKKSVKKPRSFFETYDNAEFSVISQGNYLDFII
jgi:predicted AAA+ superfamily ATPase